MIFLQDAVLLEAFIDISSEINLFPAGNAHAPVGEKTDYPPSIPLEPSVRLFVKGTTAAKASWIPTGIPPDCCLPSRLPDLIV